MYSSSGSGSRGQWEDYVEQARTKLPEPPAGLMDAYVRWIPWIAIVFGALGLIFTVLFGLLGAVLAPFLALGGMDGMRAGMNGIFAVVLGGIGSLLGLVGGLQMRQMKANGWWIYGMCLVVSVVNDLASISLFGLVITLLINWLHISVRPRYN
jgi:hypothetical protein